MQQQIMDSEEELRSMKEKLDAAELEKENALKELKEAKELAEEVNSRKVKDLMDEIDVLKTKLSKRDKTIKSLEMELGESQELEAVLVEKDGFIDRLNKELRDLRDREKNSLALVSEYMKKNEEIEAEVKKLRESDSKSKDALATKTKEFESVEFELAETKIEMTKLRKKVESLESLHKQNNGISSDVEIMPTWEAERIEALEDELDLLKSEWQQALEAEQKSAKAMEDLAIALAEVAAEAKEAKEDLHNKEAELEHAQEQIEQLQKMLKETRNEAEVYRNTVSRLRLEIEETLMAWSAKEMGFINCIKQAEEEKAAALQEKSRLAQSLCVAENMIWTAREEAHKTRDLLKQALNEANAAKAAAGLAQDENASLKDALTEKEDLLCSLTEEIEILRIREDADKQKIKQLKRSLSKSSSSEIRIEDHDQPDSDREFELEEKEKDKDKDIDVSTEEDFTGLTLNIEELKQMTEPEPDDLHIKILDEDPEREEALKGSIFDTSAVTPKSEPHTPRSGYKQRRRRYSFSYTEEKEETNSEAFYHSEFDYPEVEGTTTTKHSHRRVKTMFRRVGALGGFLTIKRGLSYGRKETTPAFPSPTPPALPSPPASQSSVE